MTKSLDLTKEFIAVGTNSSLQVFKRGGASINTAPIQEYLRFVATGLSDNQTAVFDIDKYGLDFMPGFLLANFVTTSGNITVNIKYYGTTVLTFSISGANAAAGIALPSIPVSHANASLEVTAAKACNYIWFSAQQVDILEEIPQTRII